MNRKEALRNIGLAVALSTGAVAASPAVENNAAAATVRTDHCATTDKWFPLTQGEINVVIASGVVIPADESVDGVKQYDNDANTASVIALKSSDNTNKTWVVNDDFAGSMLVLHCGASFNSEYLAAGAQSAVLDKRLGLNNPSKRVNFNWVQK